MTENEKFIRETNDERLPMPGELTGWEMIVFEVVDEEDRVD